MPVEEERDETKEHNQSDMAHDVLAREDAQSQSKEQQGHDPGEPMFPMNRLSQQRDTSGQWEEIEEEQPLSRYRDTSGRSDHSQQTQHRSQLIDQTFSFSG